MTQTEVAEALLDPLPSGKYRYQTVSEWETGRREPTHAELIQLRELYGFDWGWFFSGKDPDVALDAYRQIVEIVMETEGVALSPSPNAVLRARELAARPPKKRRRKGNG